MAKAIKLNKKTVRIVLIAALILIIVGGFVIFLWTRQQGTNNNILPESNASQLTVKDPQFNAILGSTDSSEPNDAATTIDPNSVVDSTGLS